MPTLAPDLLEAAQLAMDEYNAAYEAGGELPYPFWAEATIKQHEQAEQLTAQLEALGRDK